MYRTLIEGAEYPNDVEVHSGTGKKTLFASLASRERLYRNRYQILDQYHTERNKIFLLFDIELPDSGARGFMYPFSVVIETLLDDPEVTKEAKWLLSEHTMGFLTLEEATAKYRKFLEKYTQAKISETGFVQRVDDLKSPDKPTLTEETKDSFGSF